MATTCKLIAKNVLGSDTATITFSSIPQTYTDLYLVASTRSTIGLTYSIVTLRPNGSTTDGTFRWIVADGSSVSSGTQSGIGVTEVAAGYSTGASATANTFGSTEAYIPNYAGSTNKSISATSVGEHNATGIYMSVTAGLWAKTDAITSLTVAISTGFRSGSSFFLYGITKA